MQDARSMQRIAATVFEELQDPGRQPQMQGVFELNSTTGGNGSSVRDLLGRDYCEQDQSIDVQLNWPGVCLPEAGPRFDDTYLRDRAHVHST